MTRGEVHLASLWKSRWDVLELKYEYIPTQQHFGEVESPSKCWLNCKMGLSTAAPFSPPFLTSFPHTCTCCPADSLLSSHWQRVAKRYQFRMLVITTCPLLCCLNWLKCKANWGLLPHTRFSVTAEAMAKCYFERYKSTRELFQHFNLEWGKGICPSLIIQQWS